MGLSAAVVNTAVSYKQYEEGKDAATKAKDKQADIEAAEKKKKEALDTEIAAEKKKANEKAKERLLRKGHGGTVLGGAADKSILGAVG